MGEIKQSASASAEANAVKLSGNTVNFNLSPGGTSDRLGPLASIVRLVSPAFYERREAEARAIRAESVIEAARRIYDEFPCMSERRAVMEAMGYRMTNEQADNVVEVLEEAQGILDSRDREARGLLPEARDTIFEGSRGAYDKDVRSLWARLAAEEASHPGVFSLRTLRVLSSMDATDVKDFSTLCTCIVRNERAKTYRDKVHILLHSSRSGRHLNGGAFDYGRLSSLESIGLLSTSVFDVKNLNHGQTLELSTASSVIVARNDHDKPKACSFHISLTRAGLELSTLCEWGTCPNLDEFAAIRVRECGLTLIGTYGNDGSEG
ncbi:DUF2806 domain-containing protein [Olsenella sp. SW781]|uniref:DUF2806 domain-containing protein n=1 Tax=Olsenella sp. SW781 TaxID=2530046 RepID=UPI00143B0F8B|nr:DUF2806 domain-containing protein [Olsenella sp. SW781]NJE80691.1 DUF2806 domain-containing protein [Olsenella sp. SW781]